MTKKKTKFQIIIHPLQKKMKAADVVSNLAESIINTVQEPLFVLHQKLRVIETNRSSYYGKYDRRKIP